MIKGLTYPGSKHKYVSTDMETTAAKDSTRKPPLPPGKPTLFGMAGPTPPQPRPAKGRQPQRRAGKPTKWNA